MGGFGQKWSCDSNLNELMNLADFFYKVIHKKATSYFNPIQDWGEGGQKSLPTSFSPVTSTNVGISRQNFVTFSFNPFDKLL